MTEAYSGDFNDANPMPEAINAVQGMLDLATEQGNMDATPSVQCRVCRDDLARLLINKLLARALTIEDILDVVEPYNRTLKYKARITYDSIRRHRTKHFPMQVPLNAVLRNVVERRALEAGTNIETATGTLINAMSFLETVMIRGYESASDPGVPVSIETGMKAATKLYEIERKDEGLMERAHMLAEMNRIIELVRTYVPQDRWPALQAALKGEPAVIEGQLAADVAPARRLIHIDDSPDEEDE